MWQVGEKIGDYELVAKLRDGGMASLFLGKRVGPVGFSRMVALKVVHPELSADAQFRDMLIDEAMLASRVCHPNVVHVEELGEHEGSHFLAMEYVHGCSLSQLQRELVARGRRLSPAFAVRIAISVAEALHAAHETTDERGHALHIVHRDVSPENVLLAYAGHVKLIDFGIAKAFGRRHKTRDGLLKGKFRYMSPEQAHAKPVDRRTDVYQLGIVLWELLTLRRLFDAETDAALLSQVREPRVLAPSVLVDGVPPALDAAVLSALERDPARRPRDAQTFARVLGRALPAARDVDGGALSSLLLALMQAQRERDKGTLPPLVYEGLEREITTAPLGSATASSMQPVPRFTLAGGDSHVRRHDEQRPSLGSGTAPGYGPPGQGDAGSGRGRPGFSPVGPRPRRLVRVASELRTTITRMAAAAGVPRAPWLLVGAAIGLAGGLAWITLALRPAPPRAPPLPPPIPAIPVAEAEPAAVRPAQAPSPVPVTSGEAGAQGPEPPKAAPRARPPRRARVSDRRLADPRTFDGTPLIPDPGF